MLAVFARKNAVPRLSHKEWLEKKGSKRLKMLREQGFPYEFEYFKERLKTEFRRFRFYATTEPYFEASSPSTKALKLKAKVEKNPNFNPETQKAVVAMAKFQAFAPAWGKTYLQWCEVVIVTNYISQKIYKKV